MNFAIAHPLSPRSDFHVGYEGSIDDYGRATVFRPGARNMLHALQTGVSRRLSSRTTIGVEAGGKLLMGDEFTNTAVTHGVYWAGSVGVRWTRSLTPQLTATLMAGPRAAQTVPSVVAGTATTTPVQWELQPEVLASINYRSPTHVFSVAYARTQFLGVGASGLIDTESVELTAGLTLGRRLRLAARPGFYRNSLVGAEANSSLFETTASLQASSWVSLDATYRYRHQNRALALTDFAVTAADRPRTRNRLVVGLTIRRPIGM